MPHSIFSRAFPYRQRENHSPLENYLTEIFAYCLELDLIFRNSFLKKLLKIDHTSKTFEISTQSKHADAGRPDIEIFLDNTAIIIESKIEASERLNQLEDYKKALTKLKHAKEKHLVFLTKYFEQREDISSKINMHFIRWYEINEIINNTNKEITQQLKSFLNDQQMEKTKNFTLEDLVAMRTITTTISKMDELLEEVKPKISKEFGALSKGSSRSTRLADEAYINYITFKFQQITYYLLVGFSWWWGEEEEVPYVGLSIEIPKKGFDGSELNKILDSELLKKGWEYDDYDILYYSAVKPITDFITMEEDNIPAMKKYVESNLEILVNLKEKYPSIFKK